MQGATDDLIAEERSNLKAQKIGNVEAKRARVAGKSARSGGRQALLPATNSEREATPEGAHGIPGS
ncbi:hypothetical protein A0H81_12004 [Grifola frondosa]|uniref:Uncharacterized protein n=1 Tax=Grifola frondosa TaxID=5627 RepID=A0A1C7LTX0_GRIFR|nr:hypothetical protein A0H81_12005 [Grifola frondosa]OBZ68231.1 hypothetical protein A0H81_12004 [Grifola frondosa]